MTKCHTRGQLGAVLCLAMGLGYPTGCLTFFSCELSLNKAAASTRPGRQILISPRTGWSSFRGETAEQEWKYNSR